MKYSLLAASILSLGIGLSGAAHAVNVGVSIGVPGPVYVAPPPPPPPRRVVVVREGWYGDRYYDGHRYWARREWEARQRHREYREDRRHERYEHRHY